MFGTWNVRRLNQSRSKVAPKAKFPAGLGGKNVWAPEPFQIPIDSDAAFFMHLIQCIRFGSWSHTFAVFCRLDSIDRQKYVIII